MSDHHKDIEVGRTEVGRVEGPEGNEQWYKG
jgi:hypothetical protein